MTQPLPLTWATDQLEPGRTLFVLFAYHGRDRDEAPAGWLDRLGGPGARGHRIVHRDHYANPRSLPYQVAMIAAVQARLTPDASADLVIDRAFGGEAAGQLAGGFGRVEVVDLAAPRTWRNAIVAHTEAYRHVVLIYPDALGLGCQNAERRLLRDRESVLIVNGRRRVLAVTPTFSYQLDLRRWLAETRAAERLFAVVVRPVAGLLATWDRLHARS